MKNKENHIYFLFPVVATVYLLLFSGTTSPLFYTEGMDSAVFKTMGLALLQGKTPYLDIFDHKGPLLYFINAFAQWMIPGRSGLLLLQTIGMSIALCFWYKTARLFCSQRWSLFSVAFALFILCAFFQEGNLTEEWMLYGISIPWYLAAKYFVKYSDDEHPLLYGFVYGLCFGYSFFIRPNDAVAYMGGIMTGVAIWLLYKKRYKNLVYNILCFFAGFVMVGLPIVIFYAHRNALGDMYYGFIEHNRLYSGGIKALLTSLYKKQKFGHFPYVAALWLLVWNTEHRRILTYLIPVGILVAILTGARFYAHYFICSSLLLLLFAVMLTLQKKQSMSLMALCLIIATHGPYIKETVRKTVSIPKQLVRYVAKGQKADSYLKDFYDEADRVIDMVPADEQNNIWNYNVAWEGYPTFSVFWHHGIVQSNLITYRPMGWIDPELFKRDNIQEKKPKWVLSQSYAYFRQDSIEAEFLRLYYDTIAQADTTKYDLTLLRRKQ